MLDHITPKEQILEEAKNIDIYLRSTMSEQVEEVIFRGNDLVVYMARTGKLLADAKYHLNEAKSGDIMNILRDTAKQAGATSTMINELVKSAAREEQYMVDWIDRLNRSCTHEIDWCRTLISKAKEERRNSGGF